jgi:V8-like Glu-specific endopeptidase
MNARTSFPGKILRVAALVVVLASLFGMPGAAVPARAQAEGTDPNTPVQSPPLLQGGVDYKTLLDSMATAPMDTSVVLPTDDRIRITPTNSIPWQYIAQILFVYPNTSTKICTGFFIGPFTIVTAGHCVFDPERGGWTTQAFVTPGMDGTNAPYGTTSQVMMSYSTDGWMNSGDSLYDYGAVQLLPSATIGYATGWMEYGSFNDSYLNNYLTGTAANVAGYPSDKDAFCPAPNAACLWWKNGPLTGITSQLLSYSMDTNAGDAGQDGAPIWVNDGGHFYATGINLFDSGGGPTGCVSGSNCGLRITPEVAVNFTTWSGQGSVTDCYALTKTVSPAGSGSITVAPSYNCAGGLNLYKYGTNLTFTAVPIAGNHFLEWGGGIVGSDNPYTSFPITGPTTVTANFVTMPTIPVLLLPASNALVITYNPTFDWSDSTLNLDHYHFQIATDLAFSNLVDEQLNLAVSNYTPGFNLPSNSTLYWRVQAIDANGFSRGFTAARILRTALLPPNLTSPLEGEHTLTPRPAFDWADVTGATGYTIQISKNNTFTLLVLNVNIIGGTNSQYTPLVNLPVDMTLYWRVRANGLRGPSGWSETRTIHSANAPGTPLLLLPALNTLSTDYTPRFDWTTVTVPILPFVTVFDHYEFWLDDNSLFSTPYMADIPGLANHEYTLPDPDALTPNTLYYWRVRGCNTDSECGLWSLARYFRSAMLPPVLSAPADDPLTPIPTIRPTLDWGNATGATGYTIQISKNNTFTLLVINASIVGGTNSQYTPTGNLPVNMTFYWRVRANGLKGPSLWSSPVWSFVTPNPPSVPLPTLPALNSLQTDYSPLLKWSKPIIPTTPGAGVFAYYQVQIATDAAFSAPAIVADVGTGLLTDYNTPQWEVTPDLLPNTKYYWRVRAWDDLDHYSAWSTTYYFRSAMSAPTLVDPADTVTVPTVRPTFDWDNATGANGYTIQASKNNSFTLLVLSVNIVGGTNSRYTPLINLPVNTTLYWRVRANGLNGPGLWSSPVWSFVTPNPPSVPLPTLPALNSLQTDYSPLLKWSKPIIPTTPGAGVFAYYQVQVATDAAFTAVVRDVGTGLLTDYNTPQWDVTPDLLPNTKYYWRVRAWDDLDHYSAWSTAYYFRSAMSAPTLTYPGNAAVINLVRPPFDWADVAGATGYTIQVSKNNTFTLLVVNASVIGGTNSQYTPLVNLPVNMTLYWRVRANGLNGPSLWSTGSFMVVP